jgi:hypothetical protein
MVDPLIQEMQQFVGTWLRQSDWCKLQLIDWLQGFGLPSAIYGDEPFQWLLRGVPLAAERYPAEREFSYRAALVLEDQPDVHLVGRRPNEVLYNLLELCAGLSTAEHLADPLKAIFERRKLTGAWRGIDLRSSLRRALIANQKDDHFEFVWQDMLSGVEPKWLPGDYYDGFEGIRLISKTADTRGEPYLDSIGRALKSISKQIESSANCRPEFRRLVARMTETYFGRPSWDTELIQQAHENKWPKWAVSALPNLFIRLPLEHGYSKGGTRYLIWNFFIPILVELGKLSAVEAKLCADDMICTVILYEEADRDLLEIVSLIEERRVNNPYKSYKAVVQGCYELLITEKRSLIREESWDEVMKHYHQCIPHEFSSKAQELYRKSIEQDDPMLLFQAVA